MRTLKTEYFASFLMKDSWYSYFDSRAFAPLGELAVHVGDGLADEVVCRTLHIADEPEYAVTFYNQLSFMRKLLVLTLYMFG